MMEINNIVAKGQHTDQSKPILCQANSAVHIVEIYNCLKYRLTRTFSKQNSVSLHGELRTGHGQVEESFKQAATLSFKF